jgi:predicted aspartyl protease
MKVNTIFMGLALLCAASSFAMGSEVGPKKQIRKKKAKQEKAEELFLPDSCQFGNCWDGVGASVNDQGDIYFGRWYRNRPHGFGTIYFNPSAIKDDFPPGTILITRFNDGLLDGVSTFDMPGGKKLSVKFKDSRALDAFTELPMARPQSIRFELPYTYEWAGRSIRREVYIREGESKRGLLEVHPFSQTNQCFWMIGESKGHQVPFVFDTGCSNTSLTADYIQFLIGEGVRINHTGSDLYQTACGAVEFNEYVIEELTIGGITFKNLGIGETQGVDNLLGMDVITALGTFKVAMDEHLVILE